MNFLVLDVESTTSSNGNPFDHRNRLCCVGAGYGSLDSRSLGISVVYPMEYSSETPYGESIAAIRAGLRNCNYVVAFNAKFDLNWLRRYGIRIPDGVVVWDCQLFEFLKSDQSLSYPSLEATCELRGLGSKRDVVGEYWARGVNTDNIPYDILEDYCKQDIELEAALFLQQYEEWLEWPVARRNLFILQCQDLAVLQEIEFNGMLYDTQGSLDSSKEYVVKLEAIDEQLYGIVGDRRINFSSGEHLSVVLYGGRVTLKWTEPNGVWASGDRKGTTRYKHLHEEVTYPRLVEPRRGSELKKEGFFSTDQAILRSLKAKGKAKKIIDLILERAELDKCNSTYLEGLPKLIDKMGWENDIIHGTINQCVAVTGRTSCSKPNMQNLDNALKHLFPSRFE